MARTGQPNRGRARCFEVLEQVGCLWLGPATCLVARVVKARGGVSGDLRVFAPVGFTLSDPGISLPIARLPEFEALVTKLVEACKKQGADAESAGANG